MIDYCGSGISVGLYSQAWKACTSPASRPKKDPGVSDSYQWASGKRELTCLKQSPEATPHQLQQSLLSGTGEPLMRGISFTLAHWLPGKLAECPSPHL